jgi:hypothetical protein
LKFYNGIFVKCLIEDANFVHPCSCAFNFENCKAGPFKHICVCHINYISNTKKWCRCVETPHACSCVKWKTLNQQNCRSIANHQCTCAYSISGCVSSNHNCTCLSISPSSCKQKNNRRHACVCKNDIINLYCKGYHHMYSFNNNIRLTWNDKETYLYWIPEEVIQEIYFLLILSLLKEKPYYIDLY